MSTATTLFDSDSDDELERPLIQSASTAYREKLKLDSEEISAKQQTQGTKGASDGESTEKGEDEVPKKGVFKFVVVTGVTLVAVAASGVAMYITGTVVVYVMGGLCCAVAPLVVSNEVLLVKRHTFRDEVGRMLKEVERLEEQNKALSGHLEDLERDVRAARHVELRLQDATTQQGMNARDVVALVRENRQIVHQMHDNVRSNAAQIIVQTVLRADTSRNFRIDEDEIPGLLVRLRHIDYLVIDEDRLEHEVRKNPSVDSVVQMALGLLREDLSHQDIIFSIATDATGGGAADATKATAGNTSRRMSLPPDRARRADNMWFFEHSK